MLHKARARMAVDYFKMSMDMHKQCQGKIGIESKFCVKNKEDLCVAYTPGVAEPCLAIAKDPELSKTLTIRGNAIAVVTDGTAVLGLGNIGPEAAMPVMEGKALLFKQYANIDAWPLCLDTTDPKEIIKTIRYLAPSFGGINLEDIAAPRCFEIENELQDLGIPVFHDDQFGTAIVCLAAIINATKVVNKKVEDLNVVISGPGAAGSAIARLIAMQGFAASPDRPPVHNIILCDEHGALVKGRSHLTPEYEKLLEFTNKENRGGKLSDVIEGADVFIGVSRPGVLKREDVAKMSKDAIVLAMANPKPEIMPDEAKAGGAAVIGTGRSDFPNQVNNVLVFPGIFRGALDAKAKQITPEMKIAAAYALADLIKEPTADKIIPDPFDPGVAAAVAEAVRLTAENQLKNEKELV